MHQQSGAMVVVISLQKVNLNKQSVDNRLAMMAEVATENVFLKETPLTSTKNKFLDSEFYEKWCPNLTAIYGMKRKYDLTCLESFKTKEDALVSTKNKFLKKATNENSRSNEKSRSKKLRASVQIFRKRMCAKVASRRIKPLSDLDRGKQF
ncbi:hypothetical protein TNCT_496381 [Trichonephila clavata]|uniref:Uncharacterized protein n=1 Tax=Trichonephila clavata TaxID=2740835 RepID=A0A8X6I2Y1_TRICU|nr:hypothetical protein TNCT_496381 [Trichonephila clavata]